MFQTKRILGKGDAQDHAFTEMWGTSRLASRCRFSNMRAKKHVCVIRQPHDFGSRVKKKQGDTRKRNTFLRRSHAPSSSYPSNPSLTVLENSRKELHWSNVTRVLAGHCFKNSTNPSVYRLRGPITWHGTARKKITSVRLG